MEINDAVKKFITDRANKIGELNKLKKEIIAYCKENCEREDPIVKGKYDLKRFQQEDGVAIKPNLFAEALFIGYHQLLDELDDEFDEFLSYIDSEKSTGIVEMINGLKADIQRMRDAIVSPQEKGH